jgi:hypothetical protein
LVRLTRLDTNTLCLHNVKSDFRGNISALRDQAVNQWREFVVMAVLADYQKSSPHAQSHSNCEIPELTVLRGLIGPCTAPMCQPSWSLMQALLSLSSHVQSVEAPSNPSRLQNPNIVMTTLGHFTTSLVYVLTKTRQALGEQRDQRVQVCDLRFLRRLMTLWATEWDSLSELDRLIENLQVCSSIKNYDMDISLPRTRLVFQHL